MLDLSDRADRLLEDAPIGRLATAGADGAPHAVPICFAVAGDVVYSVIDEKPKRTQRLRRIRNIEENARAALIVDRYDDDWGQLGWVMLQAEAEVIAPGDEHAAAIAQLRERYQQYHAMNLEEAPLLRLRVRRATEWWATPESED